MTPGDQAKSAIREQLHEALPYLLNTASEWTVMFAHHQLFRFEPGAWDYDHEARATCIKQARSGDALADRALREQAIHFLRSGRPVPGDLARYVEDILEGKVKRAAGGLPHLALRQCVVGAVETILALNLGFSAMRNEATDAHQSACSLIADVFAEMGHPEFSEARVQDTWKNRKGRRRRRGGG